MTESIKIINTKDLKKKPNQEEIWDSIANPWKSYRVQPIPIVVEFLENKKGRVIDFGCGNSRNMIKNKNIEYYGIDFSKVQLEHAEERIKDEKIKAQLFKSEIDKIDKSVFKDNMFDYGLFIAALHCLETEEKRINALKEFYRILKNNAEALISVWDETDNRFNNKDNDIYMSWKEDGVPYMRYYHLYDKDKLIRLLKKIGFKILEIYNSRERDRFSKKNLIIKIKK
jgi:ubiquinone/menaquinone biosynthesis C-methylase UbiE